MNETKPLEEENFSITAIMKQSFGELKSNFKPFLTWAKGLILGASFLLFIVAVLRSNNPGAEESLTAAVMTMNLSLSEFIFLILILLLIFLFVLLLLVNTYYFLYLKIIGSINKSASKVIKSRKFLRFVGYNFLLILIGLLQEGLEGSSGIFESYPLSLTLSLIIYVSTVFLFAAVVDEQSRPISISIRYGWENIWKVICIVLVYMLFGICSVVLLIPAVPVTMFLAWLQLEAGIVFAIVSFAIWTLFDCSFFSLVTANVYLHIKRQKEQK